MSVGNGKSDRMVEKSAPGGEQGFTKDHWRDGGGSGELVTIVKCLGGAADASRKERLMVPRGLAVGVKPLGKPARHAGHSIDNWTAIVAPVSGRNRVRTEGK